MEISASVIQSVAHLFSEIGDEMATALILAGLMYFQHRSHSEERNKIYDLLKDKRK